MRNALYGTCLLFLIKFCHYHCIMIISITITVLITEENQSLILKFEFSFWKRRKNISMPSSPSYLWPIASFEVIFLYILIKEKTCLYVFQCIQSVCFSGGRSWNSSVHDLFHCDQMSLTSDFFSFKARAAPSCFLWFSLICLLYPQYLAQS